MKRTLGVLLLALCMVLSGCKSEHDKDPTAFTVNDRSVGLREWNFFVRMNQMQWEKEWLDTYGDDMWSQMADEEKGTTMEERLKEEVMESICQVHLANQHAKEYKVSLDEEKKQEIQERAKSFMESYHEALLQYAGADEAFVYDRLAERELALLVADASVADYEPEITDEEVHREGICYVLISTTGLRDEEGNFTPFSEEEITRRTQVARDVCEAARESKDLKAAAEAEGLTPIESSMGKSNEGDGQEPRMLDAARMLEVGEISDPIWTEEGWFLVQHVSAYDEDGTAYWREKLTALAKEEEYERILEGWQKEAAITVDQEVLDQVDVKIVLKELL